MYGRHGVLNDDGHSMILIQACACRRSMTSRPDTVRAFEVHDWHGVFAGSRQTFWISRVNVCSGGCNGHGVCNKDTGFCTCEYPWTYESDCLSQWCPNNCTGHGTCLPLQDAGDTGTRQPLQGRGPECVCDYPYWDIDCSRAQCPNNCWGPDHGVCNNTDGTCVCVGNATVTYTGFDCYVPDPLHVFDPLRCVRACLRACMCLCLSLYIRASGK